MHGATRTFLAANMRDKSTQMQETKCYDSYWIRNGKGMKVGLTSIGAAITHILVPDREHHFENVVLTYRDLQAYTVNKPYLGATIGRFANRIAGGIISRDGIQYSLSVNENDANNHLHGGIEGFSHKIWDVAMQDESAISFTYLSADGEEGYPGNLQVKVAYTLDDMNCLSISYSAVTDKPTIVSLTNHSYFNFSGGSENIFTHTLSVAATEYTPLNERNLPCGYKKPVHNSLYDLQKERVVSEIAQSIVNTNYCIDNSKGLVKAATLTHPDSGRRLTVYATLPALQVYFGNYLSGLHKPFDGLCLEPQHYPDAPNVPAFGYQWLLPEETYHETIVYCFDTV